MKSDEVYELPPWTVPCFSGTFITPYVTCKKENANLPKFGVGAQQNSHQPS